MDLNLKFVLPAVALHGLISTLCHCQQQFWRRSAHADIREDIDRQNYYFEC